MAKAIEDAVAALEEQADTSVKLQVLKEDDTEYGMVRVTEYKAITDGKTIVKQIYVPNKLVNIVAK